MSKSSYFKNNKLESPYPENNSTINKAYYNESHNLYNDAIQEIES